MDAGVERFFTDANFVSRPLDRQLTSDVTQKPIAAEITEANQVACLDVFSRKIGIVDDSHFAAHQTSPSILRIFQLAINPPLDDSVCSRAAWNDKHESIAKRVVDGAL